MRHQSKSQGFWGWVVLGLCALAVLAGAFQASRTKTAKDPQAIETPSVILDQTDPKGDDAEEVSVPVTIPVLPEKPEVPASAGTDEPEPAEPIIAAAPQITVPPLDGETVAAFSADALQYNDTLADWRTHEGLDIAAAEGTEVCAARAGTVESVTVNDLLGSTVVLDHGDGRKTVYASLSPEVPVKAGDSVRAGQVIGAVGNSSLSEMALGPHLHFAVLQDEEPIDPQDFLEN